MRLIAKRYGKDELFYEFGPKENFKAASTGAMLKNSGFDVESVSESEYEARMEAKRDQTREEAESIRDE